MFQTMVEGINLSVTMEENVKINIEKNSDSEKVYEIIVNSMPRIMDVKCNTELCIMDEDLGISLILAVHWSSERDIVIHVLSMIKTENILFKKNFRISKIADVISELKS